MPYVRVELVVLAIVSNRLQVLLVSRARDPEVGKWSLPGGVLRIDMDASVEDAARRVANERIGYRPNRLEQLCTVGGTGRDARAPWTLSVVFTTLLQPSRTEFSAGKRVAKMEWRDVDDASARSDIAFDHQLLIERSKEALRADVRAMKLPAGLIQEPFTLAELQVVCEIVLSRSLDKSSFRRKLEIVDSLEALPGVFRTGPFRPAQLYQWRAPRL